MPSDPNSITISRPVLISIFSLVLDYRERAKITAMHGKIVQAIDPDEIYYHVEPSREDGPEWCVLWRIADWRTHYENWKKQKERDALERSVNVHFSDVKERAMRKLRASPIFSLLPEEAQESLLMKFLLKRDAASLAVFAPGVRLDDLLAADGKLQEFSSTAQKK